MKPINNGDSRHPDSRHPENAFAAEILTELIANLEPGSLEAPRGDGCCSDKELLSYADLSLSGARRKQIALHLAECATCAARAGRFYRISAPMRRLHSLSFPALMWRYYRANGHQAPLIEAAWERHRATCRPCERRSRRLLALKLRIEHEPEPIRVSPRLRMAPLATFAAGVVLTALILPRMSQAPQINSPNHGLQTGEKIRAAPDTIPDTSAEGQLDLMLRPTAPRLDSTLEAWQSLPAELELEQQVAIGSICLRAAAAETDPARKVVWLQRSEQELESGRKSLDRRLQQVRASLTQLSRSVGAERVGQPR